MMGKKLYIIALSTFILYLSSIFFVKYYPDFNLRWISFVCWITSLLILPAYLLKKNQLIERCLKFLSIKEFFTREYALIILLFVSFLLSFVFLKDYPFVALGDEIRDGGINAYQIASGELKNIYGYGRYESHGLIIPTVSSFFYKVFANSVLTYRIPSALISILSIITLYFAVRTFLNKRASFFAGLILATSHLHLYYSRTEIVIIFTSLLTSAIILTFGIFRKFKSIEYYALMGLVLGFSSGFHASTRTIVFITLIAIFFSETISFIKERHKAKQLVGLGLLLLFSLIGFGPKILYTTPEIFFHLRTVPVINDASSPISVVQELTDNQTTILHKYIDSFGMFIDKPLASIPFHFQAQETLLQPVLSFFLLIGIFFAFIFKTNNFFKYLIFYLLLIPLFNSSLTNCYQCNYRLVPLLIISAIFAGLGIDRLALILRRTGKYSKQLIAILFLVTTLYLFYQGYLFFSDNLASRGKSEQDYLSMHSIYFINNNQDYKKLNSLCFYVSPNNFAYLKLLHIQEQYQYFIPNKYFYIIRDNEIRDNNIYISNDCSALSKNNKFSEFKYCDVKNKFTCPASMLSYSLFVRKNQNISSHPEIDNKLIHFVIPPKPLLVP